mgnify:CR=1 FL=1
MKRYVLEQFYWQEDQNIYTICEHFGIERSSAYNKKESCRTTLDVASLW